MRLIHTSDWHLGRAFHGVRLLDAQAAYLDHLVETARSESVDAVVVAGDVYDRAIPAPDAVELLSDVLHRLQAVGTQVVLSPGNHDSARRLGFGSGLLEHAGVHIRTSVDDLARPVLVGDGAIYALPYLDPASVSVTDALGVSTRSHAAVISAAMDRVRADAATRGPRTVVAAHCFAVGGASSDSERDIACGGVSAVPTSVFDGVSYVALGHLHGAQQVGERAWYSGSPVAMSFSEAGHTKCSLLVEVDETGTAHVERLAAPVTRRLATLRGDLEDLLADPALEDARDAWVQATLTDTLAPRRAMEQLRTRFPHTLSLVLDPRGGVVREHRRPSQVAGRAAVEVCTDFVADVRPGGTVGDDERALLREAVEAVQRAHDDEGSASTVAGERGVA